MSSCVICFWFLKVTRVHFRCHISKKEPLSLELSAQNGHCAYALQRLAVLNDFFGTNKQKGAMTPGLTHLDQTKATTGGAVEVEEFLLGCLRLGGHARAMDIAKLTYDQTWLIKSQGNFFEIVKDSALQGNASTTMDASLLLPKKPS